MKFYNQQHEFYCGIDLHANSMHVCVVDHKGEKHLHRNFDTKKLPRFLAALEPFEKSDLIIGCESTFNWYWLADLCHQRNLAFLLGHALYLRGQVAAAQHNWKAVVPPMQRIVNKLPDHVLWLQANFCHPLTQGCMFIQYIPILEEKSSL